MYRKNAALKSTPQWARRIAASRRAREEKAVRWRENKALLLGTEGVKGFKRGELVNLAWGAFQQLVGAVYAQNPRPIIREKKAVLGEAAKMLTDIVISDLEDMQARYVTRLAIMDVFYAGFGFVVEKLQSDVTARTFRYSEDGGEDAVEVPTNQRYTLHRIHPETILFDSVAAYPDLRDSMWLGLPFYPTKKELKEDKLLYVNDDILGRAKVLNAPPAMDQNAQSGAKWDNPKNTDAASDGTDESDDMAQVECIEIFDRVGKKKLYFIAGCEDECIGEEDWPVELRLNGELQFPGTMLYFNENPDELYPIPELSMIAPQLKQFSVLFRQMLRDAVTKWRKFVVQGDKLQKGHVANLLEGSQNQIISVDGSKIPATMEPRLDDIVRPLPDPAIDRDTTISMEIVKKTMYEIIGSGDLASGGMRNTRSATEAAALTDFLRSRMTTRTENMDAFFKALITKHVLYLQETLAEPRVILTTDTNGLSVWKEYDRQNIQGAFAFSVIAGSSMPQNTETKRQENIAFFQQIMPAIQQQGGNIKPIIDWIAPFYSVPQHLVEESFNNHPEALKQLALMFLAIHQGAKIPGAQLLEAISAAVNTGLSPAELAQIQQNVAQQAAKAPGGLPGSNPSQQTM